MPMYEFRCKSCGHRWEQLMPLGKIPPCGECKGEAEKLWTGRGRATGGDEIPGGMVIENLGHEPVTVYSKTELKRVMRERNLEPFIRHTPVPGTDKSPHTTSWDVVSPDQLKKAAELVSRPKTGYHPVREVDGGVNSSVHGEVRSYNPDAPPARFDSGHIIDPSGELE